mmetsp:Transcript_4413/g.6449  ORF Transcript_4413/g.6449 Transcript_4413/m.6449 type:complete len:440 (+) Transcript_4413:74-1393(+)
MVSCLWLVLGSHVSGAVDRSQGQAVPLSHVATEGLRIISAPVERSGLLVNSSAQRVDPGEGSGGGHGSVDVSGVFKHAVLTLERLPDPLGSGLEGGVVDVSLAHGPALDIVGDVEGASDVAVVQVIGHTAGEHARRSVIVLHVLLGALGGVSGASRAHLSHPRGVVEEGGVLAVGLQLSGHGSNSELVGQADGLLGGVGPALAEDIVDVDSIDIVTELVNEVHAFVRGFLVELEATIVATELVHLVVGLGIEKRVPERHLDIGRDRVVLPVSDTVSDHHTLEGDLEGGGTLVVSVDLVQQVRDVDTGVRLTRDVEIVGLVAGEFVVPALNGFQVVFSLVVIVKRTVVTVIGVAVGVANAGGVLDVKDIGLFVPRLLVLDRGSLTIRELPRAVFLQEGQHGGASGATIVPHDDGVAGRGVLTLQEQVMNLLGGLGEVDVS